MFACYSAIAQLAANAVEVQTALLASTSLGHAASLDVQRNPHCSNVAEPHAGCCCHSTLLQAQIHSSSWSFYTTNQLQLLGFSGACHHHHNAMGK